MMLQPDQPVTVTMTARQWQEVLTILARGRFSRVAPLIADIQRQALAPLMNGADASEGAHVPH